MPKSGEEKRGRLIKSYLDQIVRLDFSILELEQTYEACNLYDELRGETFF